MLELGLYHNDIKLDNMMAKKEESDGDFTFKLYLIDVDTMSDEMRSKSDETIPSCTFTNYFKSTFPFARAWRLPQNTITDCSCTD